MHVYMIEATEVGTLIVASEKQAREHLEAFGYLVTNDTPETAYDDSCMTATISDGYSGRIVMGRVWKMPVIGFVSL